MENGNRLTDLVVNGALVDRNSVFFAIALARWVESGSSKDREAVLETAAALVRAWVEAVRWALLQERFPGLLNDSEVDCPRASLYVLALMGNIMDSGQRRRGEVVWMLGRGDHARHPQVD